MKNSKKLILAVLALTVALIFAGCGNKTAQPAATPTPEPKPAQEATSAPAAEAKEAEATAAPAAETKEAEAKEPAASVTVKIGASVTPHAVILNFVKEQLKGEGVDLQVVEYNDYVLPNTAVESGDLDANYFQHTPYLNDFNANNGTHLVSVGAVHYEPFGIYAGKTASIADLPDGASIAVPNDGSNEARALYLLEAQGLIKLDHEAGFTVTKLNITDNPKNLDIREIEAAQIPRVLQDVDLGVINGNYAIEAGLKIADALATEASDSDSAKTYANVLVVKEGNENSEAIAKVFKAITTDAVKDFIAKEFGGAVVPMF